MFLSRDAILNSSDLKTKSVEVAEWNGTVRLREMSLKNRMELFSRFGKKDEKNPDLLDMAIAKSWAVAISVVDADGNRVFDESDIERIAEKKCDVIERLVSEMQALNGFAEKSAEEAEKN